MAKCLRPHIEKIITKAIHANEAESSASRISIIRDIDSRLRNSEALSLLLNVAARIFQNRPGGYTRIMKCGYRVGDAAPLSTIQLVLDDISLRRPASQSISSGVVSELYPILKKEYLQNILPNQRTSQTWAGYPFPTFAISTERLSPRSIRTRISIPDRDSWSTDGWPTIASKRVSLELKIEFLASPLIFNSAVPSAEIHAEGAQIQTGDAQDLNDTVRIELDKNQPDLVTLWLNPFNLKNSVTIETIHKLSTAETATVSIALIGPYATLHSIRSYNL